AKNRVPLTFVRLVGFEFSGPGLISLTRTVPSSVPSVLHSSRPCTPSLAANKVIAPIVTNGPGSEPAPSWLRSANRCGVSDGRPLSSSRDNRGTAPRRRVDAPALHRRTHHGRARWCNSLVIIPTSPDRGSQPALAGRTARRSLPAGGVGTPRRTAE